MLYCRASSDTILAFSWRSSRTMKPLLEKVAAAPDASWAMLNRRLDDDIPFQWHHHPEFELTLTLNSRGQRFIGDHIGTYDDGDLVLIGPNLPHTWSSAEKIDTGAPHVALVMWFLPDWANALSETFVELKAIAAMLARAATGLQFSPDVARRVRPMIEDLFTRAPDERLLGLMQVLHILARDQGALPLASRRSAPAVTGTDRTRIDRVLDHIHIHYASGLSLSELADVAALSPSGLHRLFRRHTQADRLRLRHAAEDRRGLRHAVGHDNADRACRRRRRLSVARQLQPAVQGAEGSDPARLSAKFWDGWQVAFPGLPSVPAEVMPDDRHHEGQHHCCIVDDDFVDAALADAVAVGLDDHVVLAAAAYFSAAAGRSVGSRRGKAHGQQHDVCEFARDVALAGRLVDAALGVRPCRTPLPGAGGGPRPGFRWAVLAGLAGFDLVPSFLPYRSERGFSGPRTSLGQGLACGIIPPAAQPSCRRSGAAVLT